MAATILVAEDNEKNRQLIRDILLYHGFQVFEAENGAVAIEKAIRQRPDLILMDIQMPVMDGMTAARLIRTDPSLQGIPVIALTSFAMTGDRERLLEAGFDDYIAKPIDTRQLPEIVKRNLGNGIHEGNGIRPLSTGGTETC